MNKKILLPFFLMLVLAKFSLAETESLDLHLALATVYDSNPEIQTARAELHALDERYSQALAAFRPNIAGELSYGAARQHGNVTGRTHSDQKDMSLEVTQSLFSGGSSLAGLTSAEKTIQAGKAKLRSVEQNVLLKAITAYMDVLRDKEIVNLNLNNENVLKKQLKASRERFKLGAVTKTDVSQAQARVSQATAARIAAQGNLKVSRANFERIVGRTADHLTTPKAFTDLPSALDDALKEAESNNPDMALARYESDAAAANTRSAIGELLPQIGVTGALSKTYDSTSLSDDRTNEQSVVVTATIPLYAAGKTHSKIRESRKIEEQKKFGINKTERDVRETVIDAWEKLAAAKAEVEARKAQIAASKLARDGVKAESDYGSRTTLDLLDAEQEYLEAQVEHVSAKRNEVISSYGLLAALGRLDPQTLKIDTAAQDQTPLSLENINQPSVKTQ